MPKGKQALDAGRCYEAQDTVGKICLWGSTKPYGNGLPGGVGSIRQRGVARKRNHHLISVLVTPRAHVLRKCPLEIWFTLSASRVVERKPQGISLGLSLCCHLVEWSAAQ